MSKNNAATLVNSALLGLDYEVVLVGGKRYIISPPTIKKLSGAALYLSNVAEAETVPQLLSSQTDLENVARAVSWLIDGSDKYTEELSNGTLEELLQALGTAYNLISVQDFSMLSHLARNVVMTTAKPKQ